MHRRPHLECTLMTASIVSSTHRLTQNAVILRAQNNKRPSATELFFSFRCDAFGMGSETITCWLHDQD